MTAPVAPTPDLAAQVGAAGPAELAEVAQAEDAIHQGADPAKVTAKLSDTIHAYRRSLGTAPLPAPPESGADVARGVAQEAVQGLTGGAGNKLIAGTRALFGSPGALGSPANLAGAAAALPIDLAGENASRQQFEQAHRVLAPVIQGAASVLPMAAGAPVLKSLGLTGALTTPGKIAQLAGQGAVAGGVTGALSSDSPTDVPLNVAKGGVIGGATAPLLAGAGKLVGNLAGHAGLTNLASTLAGKVGLPDVANALGSRGAVNEAVTPRVELGEQLNAPDQSHAQLLQDYQAETQREAKPLYDAVKADKTLIDDPRLNEILQDPAFQKPFQRLVAQRARTGEPVPTKIDVSQTPSGFPSSVSGEDFQRLMARPGNLAALQQIPSSLSGAVTTDIPDPDALHTLKRIVGNVLDRGANSSVVMNQEEAKSLSPMLDEVRQILHDKSPAARLADAYYAMRKGGEEALEQGAQFAQKGPTAIEGENTPEAAANSLATPRYGREPASAQAVRGAQFQQGAKAAIMDKTGTLPIEGKSDILSLPILGNTAQAAKARAVAIPNAAERTAFEQWLSGQHQAASVAPRTGGGTGMAPFSTRMAVIKGLRTVLRAPNLLETPLGERVIGQYNLNPSSVAPAVASAQRGQSLLDALKRASLLAGAGTAPNVVRQQTTP